MKITLTESLGNIGKPLTRDLVSKGHSVTVISSNPEKKKEIEASGAKAAIGSKVKMVDYAQEFARIFNV
jgi:3-hydroxyisobutyrate dehydrogenase-like beta-hydroxyacid dehydrogenase